MRTWKDIVTQSQLLPAFLAFLHFSDEETGWEVARGHTGGMSSLGKDTVLTSARRLGKGGT